MSASGAASGATKGAAAGSALGPWGALAGAVVGGIGGYMSGSAKKKAEKERIKRLTQALRMFQAGSTDAFGNTLSADKTGRWNYKLSLPTQQAVNGANKILLSMGTYNPKLSSQIRNENLLANTIANGEIARANQAAAMKQGLRSGSNLGYISNAYTKNRDKNIRNSLLNAQKSAANPSLYNANVIAQLGQATGTAMQPVNSIQTNLKDMVNTLNVQEMNQMNKIAGASANPYLHGQVEADLMKGVGTAIGDYTTNSQQQQDNQQLLNLLEKKYTNNSNVVKKSTTNNKNIGNF